MNPKETIENTIENKLVKAVRNSGGEAYKFTSPGNNGMPDRLILFPQGRVYFIELKRPRGGRFAKLQKYQAKKLQKLGAKVYLISNAEEIQQFIEEAANEVQSTRVPDIHDTKNN